MIRRFECARWKPSPYPLPLEGRGGGDAQSEFRDPESEILMAAAFDVQLGEGFA